VLTGVPTVTRNKNFRQRSILPRLLTERDPYEAVKMFNRICAKLPIIKAYPTWENRGKYYTAGNLKKLAILSGYRGSNFSHNFPLLKKIM